MSDYPWSLFNQLQMEILSSGIFAYEDLENAETEDFDDDLSDV